MFLRQNIPVEEEGQAGQLLASCGDLGTPDQAASLAAVCCALNSLQVTFLFSFSCRLLKIV